MKERKKEGNTCQRHKVFVLSSDELRRFAMEWVDKHIKLHIFCKASDREIPNDNLRACAHCFRLV